MNNNTDLSLQDQKMIQEIQTLKLKYRLAVLGIMGTITAFIIGNQADIKAIFYPLPVIKIFSFSSTACWRFIIQPENLRAWS